MAGGRPLQGAEAKRAPLNMKTYPELRHRLEQAAEKTGRPLTQEVESRLERTFWEDDARGGAHNSTFMQLAVAAIKQIEERNGSLWTSDVETYWAVKAALNYFLEANRPPKPPALTAAMEALDVALQAHPKPKAQGYIAQLLTAASDEDRDRAYIQALATTAPDDPTEKRIADAVAHLTKGITDAHDAVIALLPEKGAQKRMQQVGIEKASEVASRLDAILSVTGPKLTGI